MNTKTQHIPSNEELMSGKIYAEIMNLLEDTQKKRVERQWHPFFIGAGVFSAGGIFIGAVIAAVKAFL